MGLATKHFEGGNEELVRPTRERVKSAFGIWIRFRFSLI
jgi:hypothetical protein